MKEVRSTYLETLFYASSNIQVGIEYTSSCEVFRGFFEQMQERRVPS